MIVTENWAQELGIHKERKHGFEGWYFRVSDRNCSLAVIVGISYDEKNPHSFIQTIDTISKKTQYIRFLIDEVSIDRTSFRIQLQNNIFSAHGMILHLDSGEVSIHCALVFQNLTKLKATTYAPTIMGPFSYLPYMECVHSIISTHHDVNGSLHIQGKEMLLHGSGYIEKDRGVSFPKKYIWIQSNECDEGKASLFLAIAHIPLLIVNFQGIIGLLQVGEKQYRFGSYYGARVHVLKKEANELYVLIKQGNWHLYVHLNTNERYPLIAPQDGEMGPKVMEGLVGDATIRLVHAKKLITILHFNHCGNEIR